MREGWPGGVPANSEPAKLWRGARIVRFARRPDGSTSWRCAGRCLAGFLPNSSHVTALHPPRVTPSCNHSKACRRHAVAPGRAALARHLLQANRATAIVTVNGVQRLSPVGMEIL